MKCSAILSFCVLASAASAAPSFASQYELDGVKALKNSHRGGNSIVDLMREDKNLSRFVEVLDKERGLRDELDSGKQATVFAPTNAAFEKLEKDWANSNERGRPEWRDVIQYHVAPESDISRDSLHGGALIPTGLRLKSLNDRHQRLRVYKFSESLWLNMEARINEHDKQAENGRVFVVDRVLLPPKSVTQMLFTMPTSFSTFSAALERTELCDKVPTKKGLTAFVPKNSAWEALGLSNLKYLFSCVGQQVEEGRQSEGRSEWCKGTRVLQKIMEHHLATEVAYSTDMMSKQKMQLKTMGDCTLEICAHQKDKRKDSRREDEGHRDVRDFVFGINGGEARIQFTDGLASNGAIQVIDNVMIPKDVRLPHDKM